MSLEKAIKYGKEKRKEYRKSKAVDSSCRNGGSCPYCQSNRQHTNKARELEAKDKLNDYLRYEG